MKDYVAPRLKCMLNVGSAVCVLRFSSFIGLCSIPIMQINLVFGGKGEHSSFLLCPAFILKGDAAW